VHPACSDTANGNDGKIPLAVQTEDLVDAGPPTIDDEDDETNSGDQDLDEFWTKISAGSARTRNNRMYLAYWEDQADHAPLPRTQVS